MECGLAGIHIYFTPVSTWRAGYSLMNEAVVPLAPPMQAELQGLGADFQAL